MRERFLNAADAAAERNVERASGCNGAERSAARWLFEGLRGFAGFLWKVCVGIICARSVSYDARAIAIGKYVQAGLDAWCRLRSVLRGNTFSLDNVKSRWI